MPQPTTKNKTAIMLLVFVLCLCLPLGVEAGKGKIKFLWCQNLDYNMSGETEVAVYNHALYCGDCCLDPRTGKVLQEYESENVGYHPRRIRISGTTVLFARTAVENEEEADRSFEYQWNAFDIKSHKRLWEITASADQAFQPASALLAVNSSLAFIVRGNNHDRIATIMVHSGKVLWEKNFAQIVDLAAKEQLVFAQTEENLLAISAPDGRVLWKTQLPYVCQEQMTLGQERLYIPRHQVENSFSQLLALDQKTGKIVWQKKFPREDLFPALEWQKTLYLIVQPVDEQPGRLLALDPATGREKWRHTAVANHNGFNFQPQIYQDKLLFWSGDPEHLKKYSSSGIVKLTCLDPVTRKLLWQYYIPGMQDANFYCLVPDGDTIFLKSWERLYALKRDEK